MEANTHLSDCLGRFAPERWTEYETKSKDAVCLALSWKKSPQNDTGNIHPTGKTPQVRRGYSRMEQWGWRRQHQHVLVPEKITQSTVH